MSDLALRPRSPSELVDASVRLARQEFRALVPLVALYVVPVLALTALRVNALGSPEAVARATEPFGAFSPLGVGVIVVLAALVITALTIALHDALHDALHATEHASGVAALLGRAAVRVPAVLGTWLLMALAVGVGFLCLVVPGVYVAARLWTAPVGVAIGKQGPFAALGAAWRRSEGRVWYSLGAIALVLGVVFVLSFALGLLGSIATFFVSVRVALGATTLLQSLASVLTLPISTALTVLLYVDLRARREGYDLETLVAALDVPASGDVADRLEADGVAETARPAPRRGIAIR